MFHDLLLVQSAQSYFGLRAVNAPVDRFREFLGRPGQLDMLKRLAKCETRYFGMSPHGEIAGSPSRANHQPWKWFRRFPNGFREFRTCGRSGRSGPPPIAATATLNGDRRSCSVRYERSLPCRCACADGSSGCSCGTTSGSFAGQRNRANRTPPNEIVARASRAGTIPTVEPDQPAMG